MQKYKFQKKSSKKNNKNPSRYYYNSIITKLKFQHKPKISCLKNPHNKNRPIIIIIIYYYYYLGGPKSLKLLYNSIMNLNTIKILAF